jgi:glycosyltransferase involved in cell wall biosynthesis
MANSPLVSIIIPTYNRAEWLLKSIGSVISQNYSNWELIVWDDGSNDDTEEVVKSFHDDRIHYFKHSNRGVSFARNHAIEKSCGDYIAFLDSDDQWVINKLSQQVNILERYPHIDCLFGNYLNNNVATGETGVGFTQSKIGLDNLTTELLEKSVYQINAGMPESLAISNFLLIIQLSSVLVGKHALVKVGQFNENLRNCEDTEYLWRMGLKGIKFAFIDEILINRNKPPGSLSSGSVVNRKNYLSALDACCTEALKIGRVDLIKGLKNAYRNAWLGLLHQYNIQGNRRNSIEAFISSCKYGMSWGTCFLLAEAFLGCENANRIKKLMNIGKHNITHSASTH